MDLQKLFVFSHFFFSLQDNRILSRSWFTLSVGLSTWDGFERPEAKSFVPHWPGLLYHLIRVPPLPCTAEHPQGHIYWSNENLTSKQSPGNSIVFHAESFHLKNNLLCLTNEKEGVTTRFSGWVRIPRAVILFLSGKCFRFLNVVLQTGPFPALAPRTTHKHMYTLMHSQCSIFHPSLLRVGDGCILFPTPAEQKWGRSIAVTQPEASCLFRNTMPFPGPILAPEAGWAVEEGHWTPNFPCFCVSLCRAIFSPNERCGL